MSRQPSTIRRVWLTIAPCAAPGRIGLKMSFMPPQDMADCVAVLLTRGDLPASWPVEIEVVSDPSADPTLRGPAGQPGKDGRDGTNGTNGASGKDGSPGRDGTNGVAGKDGDAGLSAYQLARQQGYGGTLTQWLASLNGKDGANGKDGLAGTAGKDGTNGLNGSAGKDGAPATTLLGTLTISESATVAISAGLRRVTVTTPSAWGVAVGQDLIISAVSLPSAAYALHDVVVTGANTISVGITTPAIALLASYSIQCRVRRLN